VPYRASGLVLWHFAAQIDVRSYVGNWGITGLVMLTVSFVDPDPQPTSAPQICCDAQYSSDGYDVLC
jgi:hypothetical protein